MSVGRLRSWVAIDSRAIINNARIFKKLLGPKQLLMGVVKSNAYGHGLVGCGKLLSSRVDYFGVDDIDEALELRKSGIKKPILVLGHILPSRFAEAVRKNISITVASVEALKAASKFKKLKIHIKFETGLNRQGISQGDLPLVHDILTFLRMSECVNVEGIYSHFAAAELARKKVYRDFCNSQMGKFELFAGQIEKVCGRNLIKHMAGTAAALLMPRSRYDLVRLGIGTYGLDPTSDPKLPIVKKFGLKPALSWYSVVAQIKYTEKGERVGYNLTERLTRDTKLAIIPVGYWQGYPRAGSSNGLVMVGSKLCKVVGRISMDMMTIDVTDVRNVKAGDVVTLIGKGLSAEEAALKADTINYELVTRINPNIPRLYR